MPNIENINAALDDDHWHVEQEGEEDHHPIFQLQWVPDTDHPTKAPTKNPTKNPTHSPTPSPTKAPTPSPTKTPTPSPTRAPTVPTFSPTPSPTMPTPAPTLMPTATAEPVTAMGGDESLPSVAITKPAGSDDDGGGMIISSDDSSGSGSGSGSGSDAFVLDDDAVTGMGPAAAGMADDDGRGATMTMGRPTSRPNGENAAAEPDGTVYVPPISSASKQDFLDDSANPLMNGYYISPIKGCLRFINQVRAASTYRGDLEYISVTKVEEGVVSDGEVYLFSIKVRDLTTNDEFGIAFDCRENTGFGDSSTYTYTLEGIPTPLDVMPPAWVDQAQAASTAAYGPNAMFNILDPASIDDDSILTTRSASPVTAGTDIYSLQQRPSEHTSVLKARFALGHVESKHEVALTETDLSSTTLPTQFSVFDSYPGCVAKVQNQGDCGSSYAFTTATMLSIRQCIFQSALSVTERSPQELMSCGSQIPIAHASQCKEEVGPFAYGCDGGNGGDMLQYVSVYGLNSETKYPFASNAAPTDFDGGQEFNVLAETTQECKLTVATSPDDDQLKTYSIGKVTSDEQIQAEIMREGPVYLAMEVYEELYQHTNGVHSPDITTSEYKGLHSVVAYGWGVDEHGQEYWLLQNSWGESWGEGGRFKLIRGTSGLIRGAYYSSVSPSARDTADFAYAKGNTPECFTDEAVEEDGGSCYLKGTNTCPGGLRLWLGSMSCDSFGTILTGPVKTAIGNSVNGNCGGLLYKLSSDQILPGFSGPPINEYRDPDSTSSVSSSDTSTGSGSSASGGDSSSTSAGSGAGIGSGATAAITPAISPPGGSRIA
jgi:cathepsin B